ncbi:MAG: hypothetical protein RSA02_02630, partial [Bacteroidales bacterium]
VCKIFTIKCSENIWRGLAFGIICLFFISEKTIAQHSPFPFSLADVYPLMSPPFSLEEHPAISVDTGTGLVLGLFSQIRYIKENNKSGLSFAFKRKNQAFGVHYNFSGFSLYHRHEIGFSYSRIFWRNFRAGLNLSYEQGNRIENRSGDAFLNLNFSCAYRLKKNWRMAFSLKYPFVLSASDKKIWSKALYLRLGVAYRITEDLAIGVDVSKDMRYPIQATLGISYFIKRLILIYGSTSIYPFINTVGIAYASPHFDIGLSGSYQSPLGFCAHISLVWKSSLNLR